MKKNIRITGIIALSIVITGIFNYCSNTENNKNSVSTNNNNSYQYAKNAALQDADIIEKEKPQAQPTLQAIGVSAGQQLNKEEQKQKKYPVDIVTINEPLSEATISAKPQKVSVLQGKDISLVIGGEAIKEAVDISVTPLTETSVPDVPDYMQNLTKENKGYRLLPDGQKFEKDITIALTYDSTLIPFGYTSNDIYTFFYNDILKIWQKVERDSINAEKQTVYSRTNHFTDYINGILKTPENSDVMAYTPTNMKELKAAYPLEGITMITPPQANNKGTANLTYPVKIPAGRHDMQPDLNITYNSSNGSSWLGLGWDLNISYISVETRWGVPIYDPNKESETYLLDGETLVTGYIDSSVAGVGNLFKLNKPNYRLKWDVDEEFLRANQENPKQYYPRVEGSFRKILRHGTTPQNYWWEVTGKDGTRYFYGSVDGIDMDTNSVFRNYTINKRNIAKWYLRKVVDLYGNTINYHYK